MAPTGLVTKRATRKPFYVNAVRVTMGNMPAVAEWCGGEMHATTPEEGLKRYIKVPVERPINVRQTRAFEGDWVTEANGGFKVYTNKAYRAGFDEVGVSACGDTTTTLDHEPCVLSALHKNAKVPVGCRSFSDFIQLEKHHLVPAATSDSEMGPALSEACA